MCFQFSLFFSLEQLCSLEKCIGVGTSESQSLNGVEKREKWEALDNIWGAFANELEERHTEKDAILKAVQKNYQRATSAGLQKKKYLALWKISSFHDLFPTGKKTNVSTFFHKEGKREREKKPL